MTVKLNNKNAFPLYLKVLKKRITSYDKTAIFERVDAVFSFLSACPEGLSLCFIAL